MLIELADSTELGKGIVRTTSLYSSLYKVGWYRRIGAETAVGQEMNQFSGYEPQLFLSCDIRHHSFRDIDTWVLCS